MSATVMMESHGETPSRFKANIGIVLFLASILAVGGAAFVRWRLVVPGDATSTATNILAHERLFRMLLASDLISIACYAAMTLLFYELFRPFYQRLSLLAAFFGLASCATVTFACFFHIAALVVLRGAQYLNILTVQPLPALVLLCLKLHGQAYNISLAFFAIYCFLIGYLIFRSI